MDNHFSNAQRAQVLTEALPHIKRYNGKVICVKYGGNAMVNDELKHQVMEDIVLLWLIGVKIVLIHGGGPEINEVMDKFGKKPVFVDGLRVHTKSVHENGLLAEFVHHFVDFGAATVNKYDFDTDEPQKHDIFHDLMLEFIIHHGIAAVFDTNDLAVISFDVRQCFGQHLRTLCV